MVLAGMVPRILAVLIVAAICAATGRADAQSPPLEELLDRAMARRLSVSAVRPEYTIARGGWRRPESQLVRA